MGAFISGIFKLFTSNVEFHSFRPREDSLALPKKHVILEVVATAPPYLIRLILSSGVDVEHPSKVLLGIAPGSFNRKLVNIRANLLVLSIVRVYDKEREENSDTLKRTCDAYTDPARADLDRNIDGPDEGNSSEGIEDDDAASIRLNVIEFRIVLVDREDPRAVINGHLSHAGAVANKASESGQEEQCDDNPNDNGLDCDVRVLVIAISQDCGDSDKDRDAEHDICDVPAPVELVRWEGYFFCDLHRLVLIGEADNVLDEGI